MDNLLCKWNTLPDGLTKSKYFAQINEPHLNAGFTPVISFSHFVPCFELIQSLDVDKEQVNKERRLLGLGELEVTAGQGAAGFNFTRYAGSKRLYQEIMRLNPLLHVYGHQHRNRDREVDGVRFVSHCLGNLREQADGWTWGLQQWKGPKQIWPPATDG
jgi:hypothetical protein